MTDFEQRYFKFLSGSRGVHFTEESTPGETAQKAFNALLACYPAQNHNVLTDPLAQPLLISAFVTGFAGKYPLVEQEETLKSPSQVRAEQHIRQAGVTVNDVNESVKIHHENEHHTKIFFGPTTFNLYLIGNKVIVLADTKGFNSLDQGMLVLGSDPAQWGMEIQSAWLKQQAHVFLGRKYNPETKYEPSYVMQTSVPLTSICNAATTLVQNDKVAKEAIGVTELAKNANSLTTTSTTSLREEFKRQLRLVEGSNTAPAAIMPSGKPVSAIQWSEIEQYIQAENMDALNELISSTPDIVNSMERGGNTPLISAILACKPKVIALFLEHGADFSQKDNFPSMYGRKSAWEHAISIKKS